MSGNNRNPSNNSTSPGVEDHPPQPGMTTRSRSNVTPPENNATAAAPVISEAITAEDEFNIDTYLTEVSKVQENVERSEADKKAMTSMDITKQHHARKNKIEQSFLDGIAKIGEYFKAKFGLFWANKKMTPPHLFRFLYTQLLQMGSKFGKKCLNLYRTITTCLESKIALNLSRKHLQPFLERRLHK